VRIVRDRWGIPHIRAGSMRDAFFAQGFCIAQDRAFQIDLYRRMARGTSAAMLSAGLLNRDIQNRRLGFGRLAETEWEQQSEEARTVLQAYAAGINAAIATQPRAWEFRVLGYEMSPWSPVDSLAVVKMINANAHWATKLKFRADRRPARRGGGGGPDPRPAAGRGAHCPGRRTLDAGDTPIPCRPGVSDGGA